MRRVLPDARGLQWLAALLTGVWYQPPFGTPFPEQTAFFLGLAALTLTLVSLTPSPRGPRIQLVGAGVCLVLAFLAKQNAGLMFTLVIAFNRALFRASSLGSPANRAERTPGAPPRAST